jgi:hypothetical protein
VTRELGRRFAGFAKPTTVIANGIDLDGFSAAPPPADPPSLGSSGAPWHGLERVAEIATLLPDIAIDVIGCTREDWTGPGNPPANVCFHGHLPRERYEPIVRRAISAPAPRAVS